jgi:hypothetical protein
MLLVLLPDCQILAVNSAGSAMGPSPVISPGARTIRLLAKLHRRSAAVTLLVAALA